MHASACLPGGGDRGQGTCMSDRQWIIQALFERRPCPVPYNFMFAPPALAAVRKHLGCSGVEDALGLPIRMAAPRSVKPLYAPPGAE